MAPKASRPLNAIERKIHEAGLAAPDNTLTQPEIQKMIPDPAKMLEAINFLLGTGLFKAMQDGNKKVLFKAIMKDEIKMKKDMGGDEGMVLSQIQAAGNEGIWTKHLKAKTELHQTIINRCLKALEQKQLIKAIKSVKHPTRKIYMMFNIEPSVEITGGPWYTDNELDTEFIKVLTNSCLQYIRERTLPKGSFGAPPSERKIYAISSAPAYPSATQVHSFLQRSRITDTELGLDHVKMLLDVLVFDGLVERLPAFAGSSNWNPNSLKGDDDDARSASENEDGSSPPRKSKKKGRKKKQESSDVENTSESESEDDRPKKKRKHGGSTSESPKKPKSKSQKRRREDSDDDSDSDAKSSRKKKKRRAAKSDSDADGKSEDDGDQEAKPKSLGLTFNVNGEVMLDSGEVYRAVYEQPSSGLFGWSQTPCSQCQQFNFCHGGSGLTSKGVVDLEEGPVNPRNCVYFTDWFKQPEQSSHDVGE